MNTLIDALQKATISLPAFELSILMVTLSICLVFRQNRIGLIVSYVFCYRWGWSFMLKQRQSTMVAYVILGILIGTLAVVGMLQHPKQEE